jgi:hypothetical protein
MVTGLAEAEDAGILVRSGDRLEFTHSLLASVVYAQIPSARRRLLHRAIAAALAGSTPGVPADAGARAWHLALGAEGPDAAVAAALEAAAASARSAAAPEGAAELAELARRLTPPGQDQDRARRAVDLAQYLFEAGDTTAARAELEALVAEMAPGPDRTRPLLRLALVLYMAESSQAAEGCARAAIAEAGPGSSALAEAHALAAQLADHNNHEREAHAREALQLMGQQANPEPRIMSAALLGLGMANYYMGRGVSREMFEKAAAFEEEAAERPRVAWRANTIMGQFLKYTDDFDGARPILEAAHHDALAEGDESSLPDILGHLAELELWAGDWERAARYADECVEVAERTGQEVWLSVNRYGRALVNAHLGLADLARADAEAALASGEQLGDPWVIGISLWVLGFLELSLGRLAETSRYLSRAWQIGESIRLAEPGQWRFHPDLLEARSTSASSARPRSCSPGSRSGRGQPAGPGRWPPRPGPGPCCSPPAGTRTARPPLLRMPSRTTSTWRCRSSWGGLCSRRGSCGGGRSRSGPPASHSKEPSTSSSDSVPRCGPSGPGPNWRASACGLPRRWT